MSKLINVYREVDTVLVFSIAVLMFCCLWPMSVSAQGYAAGVKPYAELLQDIANRASALQQQGITPLSNSCSASLYADASGGITASNSSLADPCPTGGTVAPSGGAQSPAGAGVSGAIMNYGYDGTANKPAAYPTAPAGFGASRYDGMGSSANTSSRAATDVLGEVQSRLQSLQLNGLGDGGVKPGVSQSIGAPAASSPVHSDPIPPAVSYTGSNTTSSADIAAIRSLLEEVLKRIMLLTSQ